MEALVFMMLGAVCLLFGYASAMLWERVRARG